MAKIIGTAPNQVPVNGNLGNLAYQDAANIAGNVNVGGSITATSGVINANTTSDAFRITQTGTGNAFVVEDSTSPDSTPFVIDASGFVKLGTAVNVTPSALAEAPLQVAYVGSTMPLAVFRQGSNSIQGSEIILEHARGPTTNDILGNGDNIGEIRMFGADGANFIEAASITASVDGTPGTNDMPGRLVFSTTADGASTPTERMRINAAGNVGIGTVAPDTKFTVVGNANVAGNFYTPDYGYIGNSANTFSGINTGFQTLSGGSGYLLALTNGSERMRIDASGNVGIGTSSPVARLDLNGNQASNIVAVAALDINCSLGNFFTKTINGASTFTFNTVPASRAFGFTLELTHTSGAVTWPASVAWPANTAPTLTTGKTHLFMFVTDDGGTRWRGASLVDYTT